LSQELACRAADFDTDDVYVFSCSIEGAGDLAVDFSGTAGEADFTVTAAGIDSATDRLHIVQGGVSNGDVGVDGETPQDAFLPFLLSRELFAALKAGDTIHWPPPHVGDGDGVEVTRTGAGTRVINVNGKKTRVKPSKPPATRSPSSSSTMHSGPSSLSTRRPMIVAGGW